MRSIHFSAVLAALALAQAAAAPPGAAPGVAGHGAQIPFLATRPVHARIALADAAVAATVERVETGRIYVRDAVPVFGSAPAAFSLKRGPSRPPGLVPGERYLLLLRGARAPYGLVDSAEEIVRLDGEATEAAWIRAVQDALSAPHGASLASLYTSWLASGTASLERAAVRGLFEEDVAPLPPEGAARLMEIAAGPARPDTDRGMRFVAALAALRSPAGQAALLERLSTGGGDPDPEVLGMALRGAAVAHSLGRGTDPKPAMLGALRHASAEVRGAALAAVVAAAADPEIQAELAHMAGADPDPELRERARRTLRRLTGGR